MRRILLLVVLGYLGLCGLLYVQQRGLIYFPQHTQVDAGQTNFSLDRDGVILRGWRHSAGHPHALLYFGGNGESVQYAAAELAERLPDHTVHALAYRGYGASEGRPSEADLVADAQALYRQVRADHPGGSIAVVGRSLGSAVAAQVVAQDDPPSALVLVTPFDSLVELASSLYPFVPVRWLLRDRYETTTHLAGYNGATLVVRAGQDEIIPPAATDRLIASLPASTRVIALEQAGHNTLDADEAYLDAVIAFVSEQAGSIEPAQAGEPSP